MQITTTDLPEYENLIITGDLSIEPVRANEKVNDDSWRFLIVGPTGAGKSSFIEALSGSTQRLGISKDQLAAYTQRVQAYHLRNVMWRSERPYPIYLIDTPGFSDIKMSEKEVIDMLRTWLNENGLSYFNRILFLTPITQPRLAGSKRRTIAMLTGFLKPGGQLSSMTFVTSMWDQVHGDRADQRAKTKFVELRDVALKEFVDAGSSITRFRNTRNSALQVLNTVSAGLHTIASLSIRYKAMSHLYHDLHERIERALHLKSTLESDLATPHTPDDLELQSILHKNHTENEETLRKFVRQLVRFGRIPGEYARAAQDLRRKVAAEVVPVDSDQAEIFRSWTEEPEILDEGGPPASLSESRDDSPEPPPLFAVKVMFRNVFNAVKRRGKRMIKQRK